MINSLVLGALFSLCVSMALTPLVRGIARRIGFVDRPDGQRKLHSSPVPLGGGIAILLAFFLGVAVCAIVPNYWQEYLLNDLSFIVWLAVSACCLCAVGLIDDKFSLLGRQKLLGQIVATSILVTSGLVIDAVELFNVRFELGILAIPFTVFWLLGAINALNLMDGLDGIATTAGLVLSLAIAAIAFHNGREADALLAIIIAGSLAGFLVFNFPPASIYLGDTGSMLIGLIVGVLAIRCSLKGPATVALAAPVALWCIPMFDVSMAILRRKLTGRSLYTADRGHLHHCIQRRGLSRTWTLGAIGSLCLLTALGAALSVYGKSEMTAAGTIVFIAAILIVTRVFGHSESMLLARRMKRFLISLAKRPVQTGGPDEFSTHTANQHNWDELWDSLLEFSERFGITSIQLNVNLAVNAEEYHASWNSGQRFDKSQTWSCDLPIFQRGRNVGRFRLAGRHNDGIATETIGDLILGLKAFEEQLLDIVDDGTSARASLEDQLEATPEPPASSTDNANQRSAHLNNTDSVPSDSPSGKLKVDPSHTQQ